jgi:outer membrane immunogenic protein
MKLKTLAIALMAGLLATPALADEPKSSWSGVWVGVFGGMDNSSSDLGLGGPGGIGLDGISTKGMSYGGTIGVDYQLPGTVLVIGIGGDYSFSDSEFKVTFGPATMLTAGFDESWSIYGRVGLDMGRVMPYLLAGYTEADVSVSVPLGPFKAGTTIDGWVVGGGIEMRIVGGVTIGAEYKYSMFDTLTIGGPGGLTIDTDRHEMRATLKYKANFF